VKAVGLPTYVALSLALSQPENILSSIKLGIPMTEEVKLVDAAIALGKSYNATMRLVIVGELKGGRRDGRWFVDRQDLERIRAALGLGTAASDA
jgi:hypothetical protein